MLRRLQEALSTPKSRVMLQLPTGGGKTRIAAALLAGWLRGGCRAAWLTHRVELSDQTCRALNESGVLAVSRPKWEISDPAPSMRGGVTILMAQTVSQRNHCPLVWNHYGPNDLLIIDEAHHATAPGWERAVRQWPGRLVGLTATPWRLEKHIGLDHLFDLMISGPQIRDMQSKGWLADAHVLMPAPEEVILVPFPLEYALYRISVSPVNHSHPRSRESRVRGSFTVSTNLSGNGTKLKPRWDVHTEEVKQRC